MNYIIGTSKDNGMSGVRIVTAAIIGMTISELTGGKFVNGSITAAFAQTYNGEKQAVKRGEYLKDLTVRHKQAQRCSPQWMLVTTLLI